MSDSPTSKSSATVASGTWLAGTAFQANTGHLWTHTSDSASHDLDLGMMAGTSPSIAPEPTFEWMTAFQASTGNLWVHTSNGATRDTGLGMMVARAQAPNRKCALRQL